MDDSAAIVADELVGRPVPALVLVSTAGAPVALADASLGDYVLFVHPRIVRPDDPGAAEWGLVPGASGCTAESCGFRDLAADFSCLGLSVYGLSTQETAEQVQACRRLHLPYPLLSDPSLGLRRTLGLTTFSVAGRELYRRSTLVVRGGRIVVAQLEITDAAVHPRELLGLLGGGARR